MKRVAALSMLILAFESISISRAEDFKPDVARYFSDVDKRKQVRMRSLTERIREATDRTERAKLTKELADIRNNKTAVQIEIEWPPMPGVIGTLDKSLVVSVTGKNIVHAKIAPELDAVFSLPNGVQHESYKTAHRFILKGVPTEGMINGGAISLPPLVFMSGTDGGLPVFSPIDKSEIETAAKKSKK